MAIFRMRPVPDRQSEPPTAKNIAGEPLPRTVSTCRQLVEPSIGELLEKYSKRTPRAFYQFDGYAACEEADGSGHESYLCSGQTYELMYGADVRVLISPDVTNTEAIEILDAIRQRIANSEGTLGSFIPKPDIPF